jgi:hypothetical protein
MSEMLFDTLSSTDMSGSPPRYVPHRSATGYDPVSPPPLIRVPSVVSRHDYEEDAIPENSIFHSRAMNYDLNKNLPRVTDPTAPLDMHVILDETGSMMSLGNEPAESVKTFVDVQRTNGIPIRFSLTKFNLYITPVYSDVAITDPVCDHTPYHPSGMTAAYDAVRYVILTSEKPLAIVFVTDGQDNSSHTTHDQIRALIQRAKDCGWTFEFVGCNLEAMEESQRMGMPTTQSLDDPPQTLPELMRGTSNNMAAMNRERSS